ncbi:hypothetical protein [Sphingobium sp. B11D3A]|uniref:head-tail joining protein n=1 Tax=Sphingobium sp. B11D3A TaxID=2940574 RepID=UPI002223F0B7|nr:hypothetical protein [Sphingobium sp. B11D3A]MCW2390969.1 hypothetical protein [Sphingobium sp. B11D3A]
MGLPTAGLATIHRTMADPIIYTGAGVAEKPITGIHSDVPADTFTGAGATARHVSFEIQYVDLPGTPAKGDLIVHSTGRWAVIDRGKDDSVGAWILSVAAA